MVGYNGTSSHNPPLTCQQVSGGTNQQQWACLYTTQKTQKHKKWHDGRLVVHFRRILFIHNANPPPGSKDDALDQLELSVDFDGSSFLESQQPLETEKFLITIEGPWQSPASTCDLPKKAPFSDAMQKLIHSGKFRRPRSYVPPPPQPRQPEFLLKRRAPIQPGELERRYYGNQPVKQTCHQQQTFQDHQQIQSYPSVAIPPEHRFIPSSHTTIPHTLDHTNSSHEKNGDAFAHEKSESIPDMSLFQASYSTRSHPKENVMMNATEIPPLSHLSASQQLHRNAPRHGVQCTGRASLLEDGDDFEAHQFYGEEEEEENDKEIFPCDQFQLQSSLVPTLERNEEMPSKKQRTELSQERAASTTMSRADLLNLFDAQSHHKSTAKESSTNKETKSTLLSSLWKDESALDQEDTCDESLSDEEASSIDDDEEQISEANQKSKTKTDSVKTFQFTLSSQDDGAS